MTGQIGDIQRETSLEAKRSRCPLALRLGGFFATALASLQKKQSISKLGMPLDAARLPLKHPHQLASPTTLSIPPLLSPNPVPTHISMLCRVHPTPKLIASPVRAATVPSRPPPLLLTSPPARSHPLPPNPLRALAFALSPSPSHTSNDAVRPLVPWLETSRT